MPGPDFLKEVYRVLQPSLGSFFFFVFVFVFVEGVNITCSEKLNNSCFLQLLPWLWNLFILIKIQLPTRRACISAAITALVNTQAITVQRGTHSLLGRERYTVDQ